MTKTRQQLIDEAGEDREVMIRELDKFDKVMNKAEMYRNIAVALIILGMMTIFIPKIFNYSNDYFVLTGLLCFIISVPLLIMSGTTALRGANLI